MAEIAAPHPSRPRTQDDTDPAVIRKRAYSLAYNQRKKIEDRAEYLRKKADYNARHKAEHAAYLIKWRASKKGAVMETESIGSVSVM